MKISMRLQIQRGDIVDVFESAYVWVDFASYPLSTALFTQAEKNQLGFLWGGVALRRSCLSAEHLLSQTT